MSLNVLNSESRSPERIREHYRIEKELAERLRTAGKNERRKLYTAVYDELFQRVPDHPQLTRKADAQTRSFAVAERLRLLSRYLRPSSTYLEIGPGDCSLAIEVARRVAKVYAVDVSHEIARGAALPENMELVISDSCNIPVADGSVDVAYSDQLMEHLHPDDAIEQLRNIHRALVPRGIYICITPNRLSGPHDISRDFDDAATGLHLKEYTAAELVRIFRSVGFRKLEVVVGARGVHMTLPTAFLEALEAFLTRLPPRFVRTLARKLPFRVILGLKLVGTKQRASVPEPTG